MEARGITFRHDGTTGISIFAGFHCRHGAFFFRLYFRGFGIDSFTDGDYIRGFIYRHLRADIFYGRIDLTIGFRGSTMITISFNFSRTIDDGITYFFHYFGDAKLARIFSYRLSITIDFDRYFFTVRRTYTDALARLFCRKYNGFDRSGVLKSIVYPTLGHASVGIGGKTVYEPPGRAYAA